MKKLILLLILLFFCVSATLPKQAILLAGQSNMAKSANNIIALMPDYRIINCSVGATSITTWQKGEVQYDNCLALVKRFQADGYIIKGIFWYQGEQDTKERIIASQWKSLFYAFVNDFRTDIGVRAPVIFAQLGAMPVMGREYWANVKYQQRISASDNRQLYMITTSDIHPYCPTLAVHFCEDGYKIIASRFVDRFEEIR